MAWEKTEWACGHTGAMQLIGPYAGRATEVAFAAGRKCLACWLIERWEAEGDPRARRPDSWKLAVAIAENKGKRIQ